MEMLFQLILIEFLVNKVLNKIFLILLKNLYLKYLMAIIQQYLLMVKQDLEKHIQFLVIMIIKIEKMKRILKESYLELLILFSKKNKKD